MIRALLIVVATITLGGVAATEALGPVSSAQEATPASPPAAPAVIVSEVLGRAGPVPVDDPELALGRVTVMPGAALPVHYHPGTQIGVVVQGELAYSVLTGQVIWHRAGDAAAPPTVIGTGETVTVRIGDALVESIGSIHQGRNGGDVPLVIYLSTLFPTGAPRAIIVDATPQPG